MAPLFHAPAHALENSQPTYLFDLFTPHADGGAAASNAKASSKGQMIRASWYGGGERLAKRTSTGEVFQPMGHTAAHRSLPFGTLLKVTAANTGRSTVVRINDRGPAASTGRSLDLSRGAAIDLGIVAMGQAPVYIEVIR